MPFVAPIRIYTLDDGSTDALLVLEDPGVCVVDGETGTYRPAGPDDYPLIMLDLGEPYETPDGP
ncbi:hypothetical protein ACQEUU_37260 [Nonomuraea sp. CA-218870]|uniref:hypothetical protein n=1 Tax=Nonomuraea sp. CA-218870 TaxID=3239998 RepID=UPI003D8FE2BB